MADVRHLADERRYVLEADGARVGLLDYRIEDGVFVALHTEIDPSYGGRGLGGVLVGQVLDDVRAEGLRLRPLCSFVAHYVRRHPEYDDLLGDAGGRNPDGSGEY